MQFTVDTTDLAPALAWVAKSIPARPTNPALAGVKLTVTGETLTLAAFDYEASATATCTVTGATDGEVLVSGRLLNDITRALPRGAATFTLTGAGLQVKAGSSKFNLLSLGIEDYPTLPEPPQMLGGVDAREFAAAVLRVTPAAAKDETLPVLGGINMTINPSEGTLTLAATDRFRLAMATVAFVADTTDAETTTALIPARTLDGWAKQLAGAGERFAFGVSNGETSKVFAIRTETRTATVRLLDGDFPKVEALIPAVSAAVTVVNSEELIAAAKRVNLVADQTTPVQVAFADGTLTLTTEASNSATEEVTATHDGEAMTMLFNTAFLLDGLGSIGGDVSVSLNAVNKPAIFRSEDNPGEFLYLLMPRRAN